MIVQLQISDLGFKMQESSDFKFYFAEQGNFPQNKTRNASCMVLGFPESVPTMLLNSVLSGMRKLGVVCKGVPNVEIGIPVN